MDKKYILKIVAPDQKGLIYQITKILFEANLNVEEQSEYVDPISQQFYLRAEFTGKPDCQLLTEALQTALPKSAKIELHPEEKIPVIILAGKEGHCLGDLLLKEHHQTANYQIQAVISNHQDQQDLTEKFQHQFHYLPTSADKQKNEQALSELLSKYNFASIILCKYMQILTDDFVRQYSQQIINIHHSFLPAFIGAKPYHQAYERGVKIIGATAHYVTSDLDEGPIIYQDVAAVAHYHLPEDLIRIGQRLEANVLAEGIRLHAKNRVFVSQNKTIIL